MSRLDDTIIGNRFGRRVVKRVKNAQPRKITGKQELVTHTESNLTHQVFFSLMI